MIRPCEVLSGITNPAILEVANDSLRRTDLDVDISNHCGRLIANVVIAYNSMLLGVEQATGTSHGVKCGWREISSW